MSDAATEITSEAFPLSAEMRATIIDHSRTETPRECCGVIGGPSGEPRELRRLTNLERGVDRYLIDETELYQVYREFDARGWEILAIYHSHPVSVAYPSRTDVTHAYWPDSVYLICSLEEPEAPIIRGFRIVDEMISEVDVR